MTREQAISELKALHENTDFESAHSDADNIICDLLAALGYDDVVAAYAAVGKWYA